MLVEDKHSIYVLTELILFPRLKAFDEDDRMELKKKEEMKKSATELFVKECAEKSSLLSEEEVRQLVHDAIARTNKNLKGEGR